ncbi:MAG: sugar ABC transporter permease [Clostridia bacterium]
MKKKLTGSSLLEYLVCFGPSMLLYTTFFMLPMLLGIFYSLTNWDGMGNYSIVGASNYTKLLLNDPVFVQSMLRTFWFAITSVLFTTIFSMLCALALTSKFKANNLFRTIIFLPNLISMVITGFIWNFLFTKVFSSIYTSTGLEFFNISWIGDAKFVMWAVVIVSVWQGMGYYMTIYIAGILGIDQSYIEAAVIDGATDRQVFWKIKLPLMLPLVSIGAFLNLAFCMKTFDVVFSLSKGGPGNGSEVAMLNIYREAFVYNNFGYGSAKAIFFAGIIIIFSLIQQRITSRTEVE